MSPDALRDLRDYSIAALFFVGVVLMVVGTLTFLALGQPSRAAISVGVGMVVFLISVGAMMVTQ